MSQLIMTISVLSLSPPLHSQRNIRELNLNPANETPADFSRRHVHGDRPKETPQAKTLGDALPALLGNQIVDRDLLRNRPLIDHFRFARFGIDDQIAALVLMVQVLAEGPRPEQRGLV